MAYEFLKIHRQVLLIIFLSLLLLGIPCTAKRCVAQVSANFILEEYKSNLANLKSGECTVSFSPDANQYYNEAENLRLRFSPQGLRMEWRHSKARAIDSFFGEQTNYEIDDATKILTSYYIRTNERTIQWLDGMDTVTVDGSEPNTPVMGFNRVFDFRSFGLCSLSDLHQGTNVEVIFDWLSKLEADSVTEVSPNMHEIAWSKSYPDGGFGKWTITFDGSNGYSPVKQVLSERHSETVAWRIIESSETTWTNKSGAWVPTKFTFQDLVDDETLEYSFDWQSVNEAIPESLFGYEEFDPNPPDIVNVVDYSFGRRIVLKPRGVPFKQKI